MKKALFIILTATFSYSQIITVIDKGVERKINIPSQNKMKAKKILKESASGIIIAFKKGANVNLKEFVNRYNLKLRKKLIAGYYIFDNRSTQSDADLIINIAKNSKEVIKTIRPNWGLNNKPR